MTVRVGVIGTGNIGADHIRRLAAATSGAEVVAVTDLDVGRAREIGGGVGARVLPTGQDVIADAGVDAVLVASWGATHEEYVLAAITAGKPVFCEKPLATTAEGCLRIVAAEVAHGRPLVQLGFMRRYDAGYLAMRDVLAAGRIGPALLAHCAHRNASVPVGRYTSDMAITDTAIHEIDALRWLLDDEFAAATVRTPRRSGTAPNGLIDPHIVLLETVAGVHVDIEVYVNCRYGYDIRCEVVGETGTVSLTDVSQIAVRSEASASVGIPGDWPERFRAAYDTEIQAWVDGVAGGRTTGPTCWDGYAAAVTADACLDSRRSGRRVGITLKDRPEFYGGEPGGDSRLFGTSKRREPL